MKLIKFLIPLIFPILFIQGSCEDKNGAELSPNHAKGEILAIFGGYHGEWILIEVEKPESIGKPGSWTSAAGDERGDLEYNNGIAVPWFTRFPDVRDFVPQSVGMLLKFKYRDYIPEKDSSLFPKDIGVYPTGNDITGPPAKKYVITKIINYKLKN